MRHLISDLRGNPIYTSFGSWRSSNRNNALSSPTSTTAAHHNPRSILFMHVKSSDWGAVIQRAKSHPYEILMIDDNGNTPLHVACQLDPPVDVLLSLKDAVETTNAWGATPLHIAASHRCNAEALKSLIDFFPEALCRLTRMHRTPIHYACMSYRGLDLVAFQVLLEDTLAESRRLKEYQQAQYETDQEQTQCRSKVTDFIDIIQETTDDLGCDEILDDEEISVLMMDGDPQQEMIASFPNHTHNMTPEPKAWMASNAAHGGEEIEITPNPNGNNYNVVTWKDSTGKTPLGLLFRRYRERVKRVISILEQMKNTGSNNAHSNSSLQTDLGHLWGKARLIVVRLSEEYQQSDHVSSSAVKSSLDEQLHTADDSSDAGQHWALAAKWGKEQLSNSGKCEVVESKIAFNENESDERQFRIVHASVGLTGYGCPPEMIRLAISIYPHQVREMDEDGNLPIHIAATASSIRSHTSLNSIQDEELSVFSDSIVSLFSASSSKKPAGGSENHGSFDKVIKLLLKQYPQAAQTPHGRSGRLPLVLADRAGDRSWNDGMKTLLRAYPPALFSGKKGMIPIKLYPHVLSLIGGGDPPQMFATSHSDRKYSRNPNQGSLAWPIYRGKGLMGHRGISLLNSFLLRKQRHIRELMAGKASVADDTNHDSHDFRQLHGSAPASLSRSVSTDQAIGSRRVISERQRAQSSMTSPTERGCCSRNVRGEFEVKSRREHATTMYELLRAKPDLIETTRSHEEVPRSHTTPLWLDGASVRNTSCGGCNSHDSARFRGQNSPRTRRKITSRSLLEKMKVYERDF